MFINLLVTFKFCKSLNHTYSKLFKSDSQRVAFVIPSLGLVFSVVWKSLGGSISHTLIRRYF